MKLGDIAFYRADLGDPIDRIIVGTQAAAGLLSWCSHVGIVIPPYVAEAVWPVFRLSSLRLRPPAALASPAYASDGAAQDATDVAVAAIGTPYNIVGVGAFGLGLVAPSLADRLADVTRALDSLTLWCSQEAARSLAGGGIDLAALGIRSPERCAPGHLVRAYGVSAPT